MESESGNSFFIALWFVDSFWPIRSFCGGPFVAPGVIFVSRENLRETVILACENEIEQIINYTKNRVA